MGTFKHYDLRTSLEVAELNTRSSENLGAKTRIIENELEREREEFRPPQGLEREALNL